MPPDTLFRRLARNTGWLIGGKAANAVLSLAVLAVAARALGPDGLGRLVLLHALVQLVAELVKFQSWQGVVRYGAAALEAGRHDRLASLVGFTLLLDAASAAMGVLVLVAAGPLLARWLDWPPELAAVLPYYGTAVVFLVAGTATGLLRLFDRFDLLAAQSAVGNAVRLTGAGLAWALGGGLEAFALAWWLAAAAAGVMPFLPAARLLGCRGRPRLVWPRGLRTDDPGILRFFLLTSANSIIALAPSHLATLVVGDLLGPAAAGLFRVAKQIADAAAKPVEFLSQAAFPEAARLSARDQPARLRRMLGRLVLVAGGWAVAAATLLGGAGEILLRLVAGDPFAAAAPVLAALAVAAGLVMAAAPLEPVLIAMGRAGTVVALKGGAAVLHVGLLVVLARQAGLAGVGLAAILAAGLSLTLLGISALRLLRGP